MKNNEWEGKTNEKDKYWMGRKRNEKDEKEWEGKEN